jgi:hypothetical protein
MAAETAAVEHPEARPNVQVKATDLLARLLQITGVAADFHRSGGYTFGPAPSASASGQPYRGAYTSAPLLSNATNRPIRVRVRVTVAATPEQGAPEADVQVDGAAGGFRLDLAQVGSEVTFLLPKGADVKLSPVIAASQGKGPLWGVSSNWMGYYTDLTGVSVVVETADWLTENL